MDYFNPAKMFISEVFPAPDGPRIAVSWPDLNVPLICCKILLTLFPKKTIMFNWLVKNVKLNWRINTFAHVVRNIVEGEIRRWFRFIRC